jgi:hypothetical protein
MAVDDTLRVERTILHFASPVSVIFKVELNALPKTGIVSVEAR